MYEYKADHAIQRAKERYNIDITEADCLEIAAIAVNSGKPVIQTNIWGLSKQGDAVRRIEWKGVLMDVVVVRHAHNNDNPWCVKTFLPAPADINSPCFSSEKALIMYKSRKKWGKKFGSNIR